jgi:hypothetical protein
VAVVKLLEEVWNGRTGSGRKVESGADAGPGRETVALRVKRLGKGGKAKNGKERTLKYPPNCPTTVPKSWKRSICRDSTK